MSDCKCGHAKCELWNKARNVWTQTPRYRAYWQIAMVGVWCVVLVLGFWRPWFSQALIYFALLNAIGIIVFDHIRERAAKVLIDAAADLRDEIREAREKTADMIEALRAGRAKAFEVTLPVPKTTQTIN